MCTSRCCPGQLTPSHCGVTGNPATKQAQIFKGNLSWMKYPLCGSSCIVFCCCFMVFFLTGLIGRVFTWDLVLKAPTILWPLWWMCFPHLMGFFSSHYDFNPVITLSRAKWVLCTVLNKTGKASHQSLGYVSSKNKNNGLAHLSIYRKSLTEVILWIGNSWEKSVTCIWLKPFRKREGRAKGKSYCCLQQPEGTMWSWWRQTLPEHA